MAPATTTTTVSSLRGMVLALMVVPLAILAPMPMVLSGDTLARPEALWLGVLVVFLAICAIQVATLGYSLVPPLDPTLTPEQSATTSTKALQSSTLMRWALSEAPMMIGLGLAFVTTSGGLWLVLIGFVGSEVLMLLHAYPSERVLQRLRDRLERDGGHATFA